MPAKARHDAGRRSFFIVRAGAEMQFHTEIHVHEMQR